MLTSMPCEKSKFMPAGSIGRGAIFGAAAGMAPPMAGAGASPFAPLNDEGCWGVIGVAGVGVGG